tara:strand:- start:5641 stop:6054 length:414 start_codon:yes stop_codon:yes gene_type:complete
MDISDELTNNIFDQFIGYNSVQTENELSVLNRELDHQKKLNKLLKEKDIEFNTTEITNFLARNSGQISDQLRRFQELHDELKRIVDENHNIEEQEVRYKELLNSTESKKLASNLREIKQLKDQIRFFLLQEGVAFPS